MQDHVGDVLRLEEQLGRPLPSFGGEDALLPWGGRSPNVHGQYADPGCVLLGAEGIRQPPERVLARRVRPYAGARPPPLRRFSV